MREELEGIIRGPCSSPEEVERKAQAVEALAAYISAEENARSVLEGPLPRGKPQPRVGLFRGPGGSLAGSLADLDEGCVAEAPWRSS